MSSRQIALVGEGGQPLGSKRREQITATDTYHSVFVLVVTPQKQLLLRRLASGKLSATGTVICFAEESAPDAARRAVPWANNLHHLGDQLFTLPKQKTYASVFYAVADAPEADAYIPLSASEVDSEQLAPALTLIWTQHRQLLPIGREA